jgi:hypothetical protein
MQGLEAFCGSVFLWFLAGMSMPDRSLDTDFEMRSPSFHNRILRLVPVTSLSGTVRAALGGCCLLFAAYAGAFVITLDQAVAQSLTYAAINTIGAFLAGLLFYPVLDRFVLPMRSRLAVLLHPLLAILFSLAWYLCTLVGFAVTPSWIETGLSVSPFGPVAFTWQLFQGVTLYAVVVLFACWRRAAQRLSDIETQADKAVSGTDLAVGQRPISSLLVRVDREAVRIAVDDIILITGANGYAEVSTRSRQLLSTTSLARFEDLLPAGLFVRVHRSCIVRLDAVQQLEPAGNGKLLLHLEGGKTITTSRTGAKLLRDRTV